MSKVNGYWMPINGLIPISQNKMDTRCQSMDLHQSPKTKKKHKMAQNVHKSAQKKTTRS